MFHDLIDEMKGEGSEKIFFDNRDDEDDEEEET